MGNGAVDAGNDTPTREPGLPAVANFSRTNRSGPQIEPAPPQGKTGGKTSEHSASHYGAMSQQGGEFRGNVSAPQKFLHLVGCREPKAGSGQKVPYPGPAKR